MRKVVPNPIIFYAASMKQAKLTELRRNLSAMLNAVNKDHEPLVVTQRRGAPVVVMSLEDYQAMDRRAAVPARPEAPSSLLKSLSEVDEITFTSANDD